MTHLRVMEGKIVSSLTQSKEVLCGHAGILRNMRWKVSLSVVRTHLCCQDDGGGKISSFLQRGPRQLIGQCVPALHLLALVLQTVDPVLQGVSL